jgi:signal transduction histidine kinase
VDGRVWGVIGVASSAIEPLPPDTDVRVNDFSELASTAIANTATRSELQASRDRLGELARHQTALRRVAELVAHEAPHSEVFNAVAEEMARCLNAQNATVARYQGDGIVVEAIAGVEPAMPDKPYVGERFPLHGDHVAVLVQRTGRPARMETHEHASGATAARIRALGVRCVVGAPIVVGGHLWGVAAVATSQPEPLPADTEDRIAEFANLVGTAIAAAAARADLIASRARIVTAADNARRRIERDLHDGAQQRLVTLGLKVRSLVDHPPNEHDDLNAELSDIASGLTAVLDELQDISRGIHPAILSSGGLGAALKTLARRSAVPVTLEVSIDAELSESVEVAAYYVTAEALANAAKYAQAAEILVCARTGDGNLYLSIRDNGIGGADSRKGSGIIGLQDRIDVLGGKMTFDSPVGSGTAIDVVVPLAMPHQASYEGG